MARESCFKVNRKVRTREFGLKLKIVASAEEEVSCREEAYGEATLSQNPGNLFSLNYGRVWYK